MGFEAKIREEFLVLKSNLLKRPVFWQKGSLNRLPRKQCSEVFLRQTHARFEYMAIFTL